MKININTKLDVIKLSKAIDEYKNTIAYSEDTFLIMNPETCKALVRDIARDFELDIKENVQYRGVNVAFVNSLKFGEVIIK